MENHACPMPTPPQDEERAVMRRLLAAHRVAVVGISDKPDRPAHYVAKYSRDVGKQIIPINPNLQTVLGLACYPSLAEAPGPIDAVNVFRRAEACAQVVREAIAAGAKGVWLQSGIVSDEARRLAAEANIDFVQDRCIMVEHRRNSAR